MRFYAGAVPDDLVRRFPGWEWVPLESTVDYYRFNAVKLEDLLAAAHLFWPHLVEADGSVFLASRYNPMLIAELRQRFAGAHQAVKRWVNARELGDIFNTFDDHDTTSLDRQDLVERLGTVLTLFWTLRLRTLFPRRRFVVKVGEEIEGSTGWAITFYEDA